MINAKEIERLLRSYSIRATNARNGGPEPMLKECARKIWQGSDKAMSTEQVAVTLGVSWGWVGDKKNKMVNINGVFWQSDLEAWISEKMEKAELVSTKDDDAIGHDIQTLVWLAFGAYQRNDKPEITKIAREIMCIGPEQLYKRDAVILAFGINPRKRRIPSFKISEQATRWARSTIEAWREGRIKPTKVATKEAVK